VEGDTHGHATQEGEAGQAATREYAQAHDAARHERRDELLLHLLTNRHVAPAHWFGQERGGALFE
jgi:hypothetical protein